jgi:hypothetical protein
MSTVSIFTNFYQFLPLGMKAGDIFYHFYHFYGLESERIKLELIKKFLLDLVKMVKMDYLI